MRLPSKKVVLLLIAVALAAGLGGAALTGWIVSTRQPTPPAGVMATNMGYFGPASVPIGPMPADIPNPGLAIADPYHGSPQAIAAGQRLFTGMNCASCHGYKGVGGLGPLERVERGAGAYEC